MYGKFKPGETIDINTDSISNEGIRSLSGNRVSNSEREINGTALQFGIKHNFPQAGEEWTADFNWSGRKWEGYGMNSTHYSDNADNTTDSVLQKNILGGNNRMLIVQTDYVKPFSQTTKLETGLRAQINSLSNENENFIRYAGSDTFENITEANLNYQNTSNVYAAYLSITGAIKENFWYTASIRAESSAYQGKLRNTAEKFSNRYPLSLFPSLFLSTTLSRNQELQISITTRINRPGAFQLTPYVDYTDNLNLTKGNPDLVPEFANSAEFSYSKTFESDNTFLASVYYKHTSNLITRYFVKGYNPVTGEEAYISTFINTNSGESYGAEFTAVNTIKEWWDITTNINLYKAQIDTDNITGISPDPLWSIFAKLNSNFRFQKNFTIQLSADYQGKTNLPVSNNQGFGPPMSQAQSSAQGYVRPFYGVNVAFKKTFLKENAASVILSINDIFRSRKSDQYSEGFGFTQNYYRLNNPQMIRLNFTYRFGKIDTSLFRRKNMKNQNIEGIQDMQ